MKSLPFLLAFLSSVTIAVAQTEKAPFLTRSFGKNSFKQVSVSTSGGSIEVTGSDNAEPHIEVYIKGSSGIGELSKEEIQKRLDEYYELSIDVANNQLTASAKTKQNNIDWKKGLSISFKVFAPKAVNTDLKTSGGSIHLADLSGDQQFKTSGGSLHVGNITGNIQGKTSGGSITVKNSEGSNIDLNTSGGSIHADNCKGDIKLNTSGGSLDLSNLKGTIKAATSGGSVHCLGINGELTVHTSGGSVSLSDHVGSLAASTSGGSINATIKELGKFVTLSNSGGNVNLILPENKGLSLDLHGDKIKTDRLNNFSGTADDDKVSGTVNGGGVPITVKASSGRVTVKL